MSKWKRKKRSTVLRDVRQVFLGEGLVPLTDELIDRLAAEWHADKSDLVTMRDAGGKYSEQRRSIIFPPEWDELP